MISGTRRDIKNLSGVILKVIIVIFVVTLLIMGVCATIGIPILNFIYGIPLQSYLLQLIVLVLSGGLYAISVLLLYVLTTMRSQSSATIAYAITSVVSVFVCNILVKYFNIKGASIANALINFILCVIMGILLIFSYRKRRN